MSAQKSMQSRVMSQKGGQTANERSRVGKSQMEMSQR